MNPVVSMSAFIHEYKPLILSMLPSLSVYRPHAGTNPGSCQVPVIFPARPLADSFTATARLSPLHVYTSHTRPLYTSLPTRQNIEAALAANSHSAQNRLLGPNLDFNVNL